MMTIYFKNHKWNPAVLMRNITAAALKTMVILIVLFCIIGLPQLLFLFIA